MAEMHDRLGCTIELFNDCYGLGAMFGIWCCISFIIFTIFGLIHAYAAGSEDNTVRFAWVNVVFSGICFVSIIQLVVSAARVNNEVR